jgi:type III pantothenate kinase
MTQLLVDIGNTRIKWAIVEAKEIISGHPLVHQQLVQEKLIKLWHNIVSCEVMAISCVSSKQTLDIVMTVAVKLWPKVNILLPQSEAEAFGVSNAYSQPEKLGIDRWLSLIAVRHYYPGFACIVDCGTAITVDLIDAEGRHHGGCICPGLTLMREALAKGTEALPFNVVKYPIGPANCTDAAIYSGTLYAAVGLIEHTLFRQPAKTTLILTGGDADLIAEQLAFQPVTDSLLVLRGLALILSNYQ